MTQPACIDQWQKCPLTETNINSGRSREPAKALRAERARLERNKPLRYSAGVAPSHLGANGVKPEHLSPPEISRRLSTGGAVIEMKPCTTVVEAPNLPKTSITVAPHQHAGQVAKNGGFRLRFHYAVTSGGKESAGAVFTPTPQTSSKSITPKSMTKQKVQSHTQPLSTGKRSVCA